MSLSLSQVNQWSANLSTMTMFLALQNSVTNNDVRKLVNNWDNYRQTNFYFNHNLDPEVKITNQKSSGRCWMFAGLNVMRHYLMREFNLPKDFEFSQSYLFFYDKLERANFFLNSVIDNRSKPSDDRLLQHLFDDPICDGGQWDMFVNLVKKYGVVPKTAYAESFHSSSSSRMNWVLTWKLRQYAQEIMSADKSEEELRKMKEDFLKEYHRILALFLGTPPQYFTWAYYDKDNKYHNEGEMSPRDFAKKVNVDLDDFVCLVDDPRHEYYQRMRVDYLGNVKEGKSVTYYNVPIKELEQNTAKCINENHPVWFGCDVGKWLHRELDYMDTGLLDYERLLGTNLTMSKRDKLVYKNSLMTHAMVFSGYEDVDGEVRKWRVENSWDSKGIQSGYYAMSNAWFKEYVYEVVVHKSVLSDELKNRMSECQEEVVLPPWDPMGSLA